MPLAPSRRLFFAACLALGLALPAGAADEVLYPARVTTMQGRIFDLHTLGHEFEEGSFLYYDGETEGRVQWRDLDKVTAIGNLGHTPGSAAPSPSRTVRVTLLFLDGTERQVNLALGKIYGADDLGTRTIGPRGVAVIDFDETVTAPKLFKTCLKGHVWEQATYHYCPYDGLELEEKRLR